MRVRFHLPNFTNHLKFNLVFASMLKNAPHYFREGVEIASFYGSFPPSLWNGGRTIGGVTSLDFVKQAIKAANNAGIPLRFTFTNPMLKEEHLHDEFCNTVMKLADNGFNEVIVNSPLLEDYIRTTYPNYKLTSSTCKRITDVEKLKEELEKDYHIVVLDYDLNNKFDILEQLPHKEKIEILANACCEPGCKLRTTHYQLIGEQQILYNEHLKNHPNEPFIVGDYTDKNINTVINCKCRERNFFEIKDLSTHVSPEAIWEKYVPMGYEQFKIEGRTASRLNVLENYMYYMIKPECRDEARFMFLYNLEKNGVVYIDGETGE